MALVHKGFCNYMYRVCTWKCLFIFFIFTVIFVYLLSREFKVEKAKQVAKEALAKQVKVSLKFAIEEVSVKTFPGI